MICCEDLGLKYREHKTGMLRRPTYCTVATLIGVAWGALAFGAVYPWAYWPLIVTCFVSGVLGLLGGRESATFC